MALSEVPTDRPQYTCKLFLVAQRMAVCLPSLDMHLLSKHRWSLQTNEHIEVVPPVVRNLDSRSLARQHDIYGASHGCRKGAEATLETRECSIQ
jgi:hypothetical protein